MFVRLFEKLIFYLVGTVSLLAGTLIYVLYRESTYIAVMLSGIFDVEGIRKALSFLEADFLKFYFVDYLWAVSLSCGLHIIFSPKRKGSLLCSFGAFVCGVVYEMLQFNSIISGTGDFADILAYLMAGITVTAINYCKER